MRWFPIKRKDGNIDQYVIGFCTHTIALIIIGGESFYEAWRLTGKDIGQGARLGMFKTATEARACVEQNALADTLRGLQ